MLVALFILLMFVLFANPCFFVVGVFRGKKISLRNPKQECLDSLGLYNMVNPHILNLIHD